MLNSIAIGPLTKISLIIDVMDIEVRSVNPVSNRELIQALATRAGSGCDCGCGCSC